MSDLTDFLLARIAEDELDATTGGMPEGAWRMLAECEAKKLIVEEHSANQTTGGYCDAHDGRYLIDDCPTLRALANVYADHADYREEWRS